MISVIDDARKETGKSWASIARKLGNTTDTLWRWRTGQTRVPEHRWRALARAIGIDPDTFCRNTYNRQYAQTLRNGPSGGSKAETAPTPSPAPENAAQPPSPAPTDDPPPEADGWFDWWVKDDGE